MRLKARVAAAGEIAGRLVARESLHGLVWVDTSLGKAWAAGMATDCHVEEVHGDGTEVWRVEVRARRDDGDLGDVYDDGGERVGRLVRLAGGTFGVEGGKG